MSQYGDAAVTYISPVSRKSKYVVATQEFDTKYLKNRPQPKARSSNRELLFCWDTDKFKEIDPKDITQVVPLNRLVNGRR